MQPAALNNYRLLRNYVAQILCVPVVRETVNIDHTKHGYYSIKVLNPTDINSLGAGEADLLRGDG